MAKGRCVVCGGASNSEPCSWSYTNRQFPYHEEYRSKYQKLQLEFRQIEALEKIARQGDPLNDRTVLEKALRHLEALRTQRVYAVDYGRWRVFGIEDGFTDMDSALEAWDNKQGA